MSSFVSRLLVVAIGAPIVLGALWLGGWWLFALVALGSLVALHEFYAMARPLRPLVLAGFAGGILSLFGAKLGGVEWMVGGFLATIVLAFLFFLVARTRAPASWRTRSTSTSRRRSPARRSTWRSSSSASSPTAARTT